MGETFWIAVGVLAALLASMVLYAAWRSLPGRERDRLRRRFGPEYERAVEETGSGKAARRELRRRLRRVGRMRLRELRPEERARFLSIWDDLRAAFSDDPTRAVLDARRLLDEVMRALGYPTESFEQKLADLSVRYPNAVHHYRAAHELARGAATRRASTDTLRRALMSYDALFSALLREPEPRATPSYRTAQATAAD